MTGPRWHRPSRLYAFLWALQLHLERRSFYRRMPGLRNGLYRLRMRWFPRDFLTGLYNRLVFTERVQAALATGHVGALLVMDIDNLAWLNRTSGFVQGDECVRHIASLLPRDRLAARIGGDEFVVYTEQACDAGALAEDIRSRVERDARLAAMRAPVPRRLERDSTEHGCHGPLLTVSVGVAHAGPGRSFSELLEAASDAAQTGAKAAGRNRVVLATMPA